MKHIQEFKNLLTNNLTETEKILKESNLVVDDSVSKIALMGSRGLLGGFRPDSDIDLGFILHPDIEPSGVICRQANELTLSKWAGDIELDTSIVFDKMGCGLPCYEKQEFDSGLCNHGEDCIGLFKIQIVKIQEKLQNKDKRIAELEQAFDTKADLVKHLDAYYTVNQAGNPLGTPYRLKCWESDHKKHQLVNKAGNRHLKVCTSCGHEYTGYLTEMIQEKQ